VMTTVRCRVDGCNASINVTEAVSPNVSFICKNHPRSVQVKANGRVYDERRDEADKEVHFQDVQFDPDLARSGIPLGTRHLVHEETEE